jgi:hypothetical protein
LPKPSDILTRRRLFNSVLQSATLAMCMPLSHTAQMNEKRHIAIGTNSLRENSTVAAVEFAFA